jgi:hypothetical protein
VKSLVAVMLLSTAVGAAASWYANALRPADKPQSAAVQASSATQLSPIGAAQAMPATPEPEIAPTVGVAAASPAILSPPESGAPRNDTAADSPAPAEPKPAPPDPAKPAAPEAAKPTAPETSKPTKRVVFDKQVLPILQAKCASCHGDKKPNGGLDVRTLNALLRGGDGGPALVPGALAKSLLWGRIAAGEMPPAKSKLSLSENEKTLIREWILQEKAPVAPAAVAEASGRTGNQLDHDSLFNTKTYAPLHNPPRLWRLSPEIYEQFAREAAKAKGKVASNVPQAFTANAKGDIQDVAAGGTIDEPTTVLLVQNAYSFADHQLNKTKTFAKTVDISRPPPRAELEAAVRLQFQNVLQRPPTTDETKRFADLMTRIGKENGPDVGVRTGLAAVFLVPDAVFRLELGQGTPDAQGRRRLSSREIAYAIAYALTDRHPDKLLLEAADRGRLATRDGVTQEVRRLLNDGATEKPRILRFFREYFGYHHAPEVFKDTKEFSDHEPNILVKDTDRLVEYVLAQDKNVFTELLTTSKSFVASTKPAKNQKQDASRSYGLNGSPAQQPVELPAEQRCGILTQPSWLVAYSANTENHAILRGKWVREHFLGGYIPDLPITVDAQLPEDPHKTLRQRMLVTHEKYCWQCHQKMNPLGLTFEMYDHFGRFRAEELKKPVDASGVVDQTGDARIEGPVDNAIALIKKLAASDRARQVFVRHAFRYWMGRDENAGDAKSLQEADQAYIKSGGSMRALIVALLTSDSFLYRTVPTTPARPLTK